MDGYGLSLFDLKVKLDNEYFQHYLDTRNDAKPTTQKDPNVANQSHQQPQSSLQPPTHSSTPQHSNMNVPPPPMGPPSISQHIQQLDINKKLILKQRAFITGEFKRMEGRLAELQAWHANNTATEATLHEVHRMEWGVEKAKADLEENAAMWDRTENEINELMGDLWAP